jgi:hypothetical protein
VIFPQILLVEQGRLEHTGSGEFLDHGGFQRGDPVHPVSLGEQLDVRLGDHPAIRDHHDPGETEPVLELRDL